MASKLNWRDSAAPILYRSYPDHDLLPIDSPRVGETIAELAVRAEAAGDTMFLFLCREANDDIDAEEYLRRLDRARRDIEQVHGAFADIVTDAATLQPSNPSPDS